MRVWTTIREVPEESVFDTIRVVGRGRVGSAVVGRLEERGVIVADEGADLVLLCVPDTVIAKVAATVPIGPWVAHVSGAVSVTALQPHVTRFSMHPLQTFTRGRGPEQLDGAWAAITAECLAARQRAVWLAELLGLQPFDLLDEAKAVYHAAAVIASNYLVTLHTCASRLFQHAGAPPEALVPLMRRVIDNGFELTGPIQRRDWATVDAHVAAITRTAPDLVPMYRALALATTP